MKWKEASLMVMNFYLAAEYIPQKQGFTNIQN